VAAALIPDAIGQGAAFKVNAAARAPIGIIPFPDSVVWRNGTLQRERSPVGNRFAFVPETVERPIEAGRTFEFSACGNAGEHAVKGDMGTVQDPDAGDGVVELLAIAAQDGLDGEVQSLISASCDLGAVPALFALKPVRLAHRLVRPCSNCHGLVRLSRWFVRVRDASDRAQYSSRGHFTRNTVTTSVNTGDFVHLTRNISRNMPSLDP